PGIEREGIAQLSLLETALWPLQGGRMPSNKFETSYSFTTPAGRKKAAVTVRAALGLQSKDELALWGLLAATLSRRDPDPVLLAHRMEPGFLPILPSHRRQLALRFGLVPQAVAGIKTALP